MSFNSTDKALIDRAIRRTSQEAVDFKATETIGGAWPHTAEGRKGKRHYDALARDAADLKSLCSRMMKENGDATVAKYIMGKPAKADPPPLTEAPAPRPPVFMDESGMHKWPTAEQLLAPGADVDALLPPAHPSNQEAEEALNMEGATAASKPCSICGMPEAGNSFCPGESFNPGALCYKPAWQADLPAIADELRPAHPDDTLAPGQQLKDGVHG